MRLKGVGVVSGRAGFLPLGIMIGVSWWSILPAPGDEPATDPTPPTFTKNVAPILQARCQNCHRRGQIGPFALETYAQAKKRAVDIAAVAGERSMPPWKPKPGVGPKLKHDQSLTAAEIDTLEAWAEAGAPLGDAKHMPPPRQFAEGWKLGKPDLVLECTEDFKIPASGPDIYRCFVIPTNLRRELFISAIDVQPGNARVVHHIIMYTDVSGIGRQRDKAEPGPGYISFEGPGIPVSSGLGFWGAGSEPHHLPDGVGLRLPKQSDVILQVHYHPTGKPETDRTRLGLYLSRKPVKQALHWNDASSFDFQLPAGKAEVKVEATWFVPVSVEALAVAPHMHSLGRNMTMSVTYPDGHSLDLIHIDDWDPSWQTNYYFQKPIPLPAGSVVKVIAHFDNSDHPRNPNQPPKLVKSGQGVNDEMCVGYIAVVKTGQDLTAPRARDDLFEIFARQRVRNFRKQFAKRPR